MTSDLQSERVARQMVLVAGIFLGAIAAVAGAKFCLQLGLAWQCPLITMTGFPCPSCGSTRAFAALAELEILSAFSYNPLIIASLFALPFLGLCKRVPAKMKRHGWTIFAMLVVLNWLYLFFFLPR